MSIVEANEAPFDAHDVAELFSTAMPSGWHAVGVTTDSRRAVAGTLFVALEGDRFDGHRFAAQVLAAGAAGVVVRADHPDVADLDGPAIRVRDTLVALGDLARHHRRRFPGPVVAIGGALGKTSTKELAAAVCATTSRVHATSANNNNRIGVPLTLLLLDAAFDVAIVELGTNRPGEIAELARITEASHALITNIAEEHLEELVDLDGVEREETALFADAARRGATLLVNVDDHRLAPWATASGAVTFGTGAAATIHGEITLHDDARARLRIDDHTIDLQTLGFGMARNALAAAAVGTAVGVPIANTAAALSRWRPALDEAGYARMVLEEHAGVRFLVDCYNASPGGVDEALDVLVHLPLAGGGRRIAVLGDMLELGAAAANHHSAALDRALAATQIALVHTVGPEFARAADAVAASRTIDTGRLSVHPSVEECLAALCATIEPDDVVLFKASHGIGLERAVLALLGRA